MRKESPRWEACANRRWQVEWTAGVEDPAQTGINSVQPIFRIISTIGLPPAESSDSLDVRVNVAPRAPIAAAMALDFLRPVSRVERFIVLGSCFLAIVALTLAGRFTGRGVPLGGFYLLPLAVAAAFMSRWA